MYFLPATLALNPLILSSLNVFAMIFSSILNKRNLSN